MKVLQSTKAVLKYMLINLLNPLPLSANDACALARLQTVLYRRCLSVHVPPFLGFRDKFLHSLVPRPSPKRRKRVWCSERHFLSHGAGPYFVKNVIIAFFNLELKFLTPQSIWTTTQPGLQKLETAAVYWAI